MHDEMGVIADQFYAERLYTRESIGKLLEKTRLPQRAPSRQRRGAVGSRPGSRHDGAPHPADGRRAAAAGPQARARCRRIDVTVSWATRGCPTQVKRGGTFNPEDLDTIRRLQDALSELPAYKFRYLDNHATLERDLSELRTDLVFNLCDEGFNNDPFKELHVPAMLEVLELALHRRRAAGARRLLRQGPGARRGA